MKAILSGKGSQIIIIWLSGCFRGEVYWDGSVIVYVKLRNKVVILNSKLTGSVVSGPVPAIFPLDHNDF